MGSVIEQVANSIAAIDINDLTSNSQTAVGHTEVQEKCAVLKEEGDATFQALERVHFDIDRLSDADVRYQRECELVQPLRWLARASKRASEAISRSLYAHIRSFHGNDESVTTLLDYFDKEIGTVIGEVLDQPSDPAAALSRTLAECYNQAVLDMGRLHSCHYADSLRASLIARNFDGDSYGGSKEGYGCRSGGTSRDCYFDTVADPSITNKIEMQLRWARFWIRTVSQRYNGPTLFWPLDAAGAIALPKTPRYLFRAYDHKSWGRSDETVIASRLCELEKDNASAGKTDLLNMGQESSRLLLDHLDKGLRPSESSDNLMSWSSSLLFVIQYAIYRCHKMSLSEVDMKICAMDTAHFPLGQFARDLWLLDTCERHPGDIDSIQDFIKLRTEKGYDNGEYLSQGSVHHKGRSCTLSLQDLINAGLHDLYPEFQDPNGKNLWAKRTGTLCALWSIKGATGEKDLTAAERIARECFLPFNITNIAVLLLMLKNRRTKVNERKGRFSSIDVWSNKNEGLIFSTLDRMRNWGRNDEFRPSEVQRYCTAVAEFEFEYPDFAEGTFRAGKAQALREFLLVQ